MGKWKQSLGAALAVSAAVIVGVQVAPLVGLGPDAAASTTRTCRAIAAASELRARQVAGEGPTVAVIGDSYSQGHRLAEPGHSWPRMLSEELPVRVVVDGFAGSGFSDAASACTTVAYADRAPAVPDVAELLVVQGGLNDYDVPLDQVRSGVSRLVEVVGTRPLVLIGPPAAPRRLEGAARADELLSQLAIEAGVP